MAIKTYNDTNIQAIADAIREKNFQATTYKVSQMAAAIRALETGLDLLPQDTASGAIASFPDGSNGYPVVSLEAAIVAQQAGTGDPSPSNVRTISGFTDCIVKRTGKNIFPYRNISGTKSYFMDCFIPSGTYTFSALITSSDTDGTTSLVLFTYEDNTTLSSRLTRDARVSQVITLTQPVKKITFYAGYNSSQSSDDTFSFSDIQIESGSTATAYAAYTGETKEISFGQTVYRGTLNVTTGILTVSWVSKSFKWGDSQYAGTSLGNYTRRAFDFTEERDSDNVRYSLCSIATWLNEYSSDTLHFYVTYTSGKTRVYVFLPNDTSDNTDIQVVFPITTPEVIQLTPEQVLTLLGENNIFADTGDVDVTYRADIDLYIAKKIAEGGNA